MPCANYPGTYRLDAIMDPGKLSPHAHTLHGGSGFTWDATTDSLIASTATSCGVAEDKSAYWTPPLVFLYDNGTVEGVRQVGGMLAYYFLQGPSNTNNIGLNITAFPTGFRMISGDNFQRNFTWPIPDPDESVILANASLLTQFALQQRAIGFNCLNYGIQPEGSLKRHFLPNVTQLRDLNCTDGLRLELLFPSCWNGSLDSADHKSHMAYPPLPMGNGACPEDHPISVPTIFFETIFDTYPFMNESGQFVLVNGDPTGYGYHGDFISGWDPVFLQQTINTCTNMSGQITDCGLFNVTSDGNPNFGVQQFDTPLPPAAVADDCSGPRVGLCGNVTVNPGPGYAMPTTPAPSVPMASTVSSTTTVLATATVTGNARRHLHRGGHGH